VVFEISTVAQRDDFKNYFNKRSTSSKPHSSFNFNATNKTEILVKSTFNIINV